MLIEYEKPLWDRGVTNIAGVDEVGRGALAGPLVVAAVILDKDKIHTDLTYNDVIDSKKVSPKKRERLAKFIQENAISYKIALVEPQEIDEIGITGATQKAFFDAVNNLRVKAQHVLTDKFEIKKIIRDAQTNIVKGDAKSVSIAAASIVAKVYRDGLMIKMHEEIERYKVYCFDKHKGYGTKQHREAIYKYGPCEVHRKCFEPVKSLIKQI